MHARAETHGSHSVGLHHHLQSELLQRRQLVEVPLDGGNPVALHTDEVHAGQRHRTPGGRRAAEGTGIRPAHDPPRDNRTVSSKSNVC